MMFTFCDKNGDLYSSISASGSDSMPTYELVIPAHLGRKTGQSLVTGFVNLFRQNAARETTEIVVTTVSKAAPKTNLWSNLLGKAGEAVVRGKVDIGTNRTIFTNRKNRIADGMTRAVLSEVKNVKSLRYTDQLKDCAAYAKRKGLKFDLYVRDRNTKLSAELLEAIKKEEIHLKYIYDW